MHEILRNLPGRCRVLDLGSGGGSFDADAYPNLVIARVDREAPKGTGWGNYVVADAAQLPFAAATFDALIANHSLEHIDNLAGALSEAARVLRAAAWVYVAVPDASTFCDKLYRWIYHGGGHVNAFRSAQEVRGVVASLTGCSPVAIRELRASFVYLDRGRFPARAPRRLWLVGNGNLTFIAFLSFALRTIDRWWGTRASVYGWALYFGEIPGEIETSTWTNVCVKCGVGQSAAALRVSGLVRRGWLRSYACPGCGAWNLYTRDAD